MNRNVAALAAFNALRGAAVGGFMALLPMYMASIGYSMSLIGGAAALAGLAVSLILPGSGYAIDALGSRVVVVIAGSLLVVAPLLPAYTRSLALLAVSYALFLASFLVGQPARTAFLARSVESSRFGYYVGLTSMAFSASRLVGPAAAGYSAEALGFRASFLIVAGLAAAGLAAFAALSVRPPGEEGLRPRGSLIEAYRAALRPSRSLASVLVFVALDRFSWTFWAPTLSAYLYKRGFTKAEVGVLMSLMGATNTGLLPVAGRAVDRGGAWLWVAASEVLGATGALGLASASSFAGAALALAAVGASISVWVPSYSALIARITPRERLGEAYSLANSVRGLAGAPGPYIGGLLYDHIAPAAPFEASAALLLASAAYAATAVRRAERRGSEKLREPRSRPRGPQAEAPGRPGPLAEGGPHR